MKAGLQVLCLSGVLWLLAGCGEEDAPIMDPDREAGDTEESAPATEEKAAPEEEAGTDQTDTTSEPEESGLSQYSSEQIEYARVWLQLGPNQDIDGLYVQQIPAGTPLNPDDDTSAAYPEDVIQLAGSRLVEGSVTYSGNGDGTVNVYNLPLRWDGEYPAGEEFYADIIGNTELVAIDVEEEEDVIRLIGLLEE